MMRRLKPWEKSTGPKTDAGKAKSSQNAYKGGHWRLFREMTKDMNSQYRIMRSFFRPEKRKRAYSAAEEAEYQADVARLNAAHVRGQHDGMMDGIPTASPLLQKVLQRLAERA